MYIGQDFLNNIMAYWEMSIRSHPVGQISYNPLIRGIKCIFTSLLYLFVPGSFLRKQVELPNIVIKSWK